MEMESGMEQNEGFLAAVGRLGLGDLDQEPTRLREQLREVDEQVRNLSVEHYEVHIQNARCLNAVRKGCAESKRSSQNVKDNLEGLASDLKRFRKFGQRLAEKHTKNIQTLGKHVQLLEILEIPQLMDTCTRNSLYDEALDLSSFSSTLQKRHIAITNGVARSIRRRSSTANSLDSKISGMEDDLSAGPEEQTYSGGTEIINAIAEEVYESASLMRAQLLQQLRQKISLSDCLRYISYLRRLDAQERTRKALYQSFQQEQQEIAQGEQNDSSTNRSHPLSSTGDQKSEEVHLRFEFLDCRDSYISSLITEDHSSFASRPYQSSLKLIDRCRENWFDVITQYKAIFASGENILQELEEDGGILARWISGKMIDFLITLNKAIGFIDDFASLANVLEQAMKFGLSLARVGADFRPLLMEPFKNRIFEVMGDMWQQATDRATKLIEAGEWGMPLPIPRAGPAPMSSTKLVQRTEETSEMEGEGEDMELEQEQDQDSSLTPSYDLLEFPVIAEYVNMILSSFNDLRQCASPIFAVQLGQMLGTHLDRLYDSLLAFQRRKSEENIESAQGNDVSESEVDLSPQRFAKLCFTVGRVMLPYFQTCFDLLFDRKSCSSDVRTFLHVHTLQSKISSLVPSNTSTNESLRSDGESGNGILEEAPPPAIEENHAELTGGTNELQFEEEKESADESLSAAEGNGMFPPESADVLEDGHSESAPLSSHSEPSELVETSADGVEIDQVGQDDDNESEFSDFEIGDQEKET